MTERPVNCWEDKRCGCEPGGANAERRGICPAAVDSTSDGINRGKNAGRFCWAVAGTLCDDAAQGTLEDKRQTCRRCSFFRRVKYEEGGHLQLLKPAVGETDVDRLHAVLNHIVELVGISRDILACLAEAPLLERIVAHARAITGSCSAAAYVIDSAGEQMVLEAHAGPLARPRRVRLDDDRPVAEAARDLDVCRGRAVLAGGEDAWVAAVPMAGHEKLPGVLELVKTSGRFSAHDEWFMREFGLIAGLGIENATHVEDLRQLRRFDKAKSRFVALLMHHIASPLATIACSLQALARLGDKLTDADRAELMANSLERIESIQGLSRRLLDLAALRSGRSLGKIGPVDVAEVIGQEIEAHQARASDKGLEIALTGEEQRAVVSADRDGLRLVFGNLIGNAVKYSAETSKTVDVELTATDDSVRVRVRDTGIGIPPEERARVFEEFHRGSNVAAAQGSGFGIGLAVVKELVDRYSGRIEVDSEVGVGTTFTVEFPACEA